MSKSTTALLLSALIVPGAGHLFLKRSGRGAALIAASLACLWIIADRAMQQAAVVLEQLQSEGGAVDAARISDLAAQASSSPGSSLATIASVVLLGCWLVGMIDAYRLGKALDAHLS